MSIAPERLEDILIAQSLGTLSPEAEILLAAYLEQNPEFKPLADRYVEVVDLARKTLDSDKAITLPPFSITKNTLREKKHLRFWNSRLKRFASFAAALVAGFLMGTSFWKSPSPVVNSAMPLVEERPLAQSKPEKTFWSIDPSVRRGDKVVKRNSSRLIWKSLSQNPEIGGAL